MLKKALVLLPILSGLMLTPVPTNGQNTEQSKQNQESKDNQGIVEQGLNTSDLDLALMQVILLGLVAGCLGGLVSIGIQRLNSSDEEYNSSNETESAHIFWIERLGVGTGAGVVVIWFIKPETSLALLTFSFISGSLGPSIFVALQNRVKATLQLREARNFAKQEQTKAEQEKLKANPSLAQKALNNIDNIRNEFREMRDQNDPPSLDQWDQLRKTIRELETITPQRAEDIIKHLKQLQKKLNGKPLQEEPELLDEVDTAIDKARAIIKTNQEANPNFANPSPGRETP